MTGMDASDWRRMVIHLHLKVSARFEMVRLASASASGRSGQEDDCHRDAGEGGGAGSVGSRWGLYLEI